MIFFSPDFFSFFEGVDADLFNFNDIDFKTFMDFCDKYPESFDKFVKFELSDEIYIEVTREDIEFLLALSDKSIFLSKYAILDYKGQIIFI